MFRLPIIIVTAITILVACGSDFDDPVDERTFDSGEVDLTRYVAVGDSLTAGFRDNSLYIDGQLDSFPNILAGLFAQAGGGRFTQPLVSDNLGGMTLAGTPIPGVTTRLVLQQPNNPPLPTVVNQSGTPTTEVTNVLVDDFNNMGVVGAKVFHLLAPAYGDISGLGSTATPFYAYFAADPVGNVLVDAIDPLPTFFTLWIGNNDLLQYALMGASGANPGLTPNDVTDPDLFASSFTTILSTLLSTGAKGVVANIGAVSDIPFFTTVPYNALSLTPEQAEAANLAYAVYNASVVALLSPEEATLRTINFVEGQNPPVLIDENLTDLTGVDSALGNFRQAAPDDLLLLSIATTLGTARDSADPTSIIGLTSPLLDSEVILPEEAAVIESLRQSYVATITDLVNAEPDVALFDVASFLQDLGDGDGISYGTGSVDNSFITGGAFSLDGVHLTARGYAIIANGFIDVINDYFNASLPKTDPNDYSGVCCETASSDMPNNL